MIPIRQEHYFTACFQGQEQPTREKHFRQKVLKHKSSHTSRLVGSDGLSQAT